MVRIASLFALSSALAIVSAQDLNLFRKFILRASPTAARSSSVSSIVAPSTSTAASTSDSATSASTSISTGTFTPPPFPTVSVTSTTTFVTSTSTSSPPTAGSPPPAGSTGNCPSVRSTLYTTYAIAFSQVGASTSTFISTSWDATSTTEIPTITTVYTTSVTVTSGNTVVPIVVIPASTTITVPTPASFTPVLCDEAYFNPTTTVTITSTAPSTLIYVTSYISSPGTYTVTRSIVTGTTIAKVPFTYTTSNDVTSTSTRSQATSTVYAACGTDNITPYLPSRDFVGTGSSQVDPADGLSSLVGVPAVDATDCCALCQADPTCAASAYDITAVIPCGYFIKQSNNATCNPSYVGALAWNPYFAERIYISNGACGRYTFDKSAFWGCNPSTGVGC